MPAPETNENVLPFLPPPLGTKDAEYLLSRLSSGYSRNRWFIDVTSRVGIALTSRGKFIARVRVRRHQLTKAAVWSDWPYPIMQEGQEILRVKQGGNCLVLVMSNHLVVKVYKSGAMECFLFTRPANQPAKGKNE